MNDRKPGPRELKAGSARAFGEDCIGSQRFDAAIMLSFTDGKANTEFRDIFLDRETAEKLHDELGRRLGRP